MNNNDDEFGLDTLKEFILKSKSDLNHQLLIDQLNTFRGDRHFTDDVTFFSAFI
jgi:hypothetical protein